MKTFKITSLHSIYVDDYEQGEGENVNNYNLSSEIKAENLKDALKKYVNNILCYSFNLKHASIEEDQKCVYYSTLVDNDNLEIKSFDIEYQKWKEGSKKLYANTYSLHAQELKDVFLTN